MSNTKLDQRLEQLRRLRTASPDDECLASIRKALQDRVGLVVAEAANVVAELQLTSLIPNLLATFERLFVDPVKADPKCWAKTAIVKALTRLEYTEAAPFLRGSRHVQMEPVWGGQEDAAGQLRSTCLLGLVPCTNVSRADVLRHLVDAMADPDDAVRLDAVRAVAQMNGEEAILLLRLKARLGDERPLVTGHVFDAVLSLEAGSGVAFVAEHLASDQTNVRDEAAFALGASRQPAAVDALIQAWKQTPDHEYRGVLLRAMSSSRQGAAIDFLLDLVKQAFGPDAALAVDALEAHDDSPEMRARIEQARNERP